MKKRQSGKPSSQPFSFKAFLSHRYKSPEVNLYFFNLFSDIAEIQFEVDEGTFAMNVTRVERMIRECNAFIGIYPFPGTWEEAQSRENLLKASQYFRLELDLAIRSRKPAIIFYDKVYGSLLKYSESATIRDFDSREITSSGGSPNASLYRGAFTEFCDVVRTGMAYRVARARDPRTTIGIALPPQTQWGGYQPHMAKIEATLKKHCNDDLKTIPWPPALDRDAFTLLHQLDWALVDIGKEMAATGMPAFWHGQAVPMMRLKYVPDGRKANAVSPLEKTLFGGVEVGYDEDILAWKDGRSLLGGIEQRLKALKADVTRINTNEEALVYFKKAARRKEAVFLSYAGKDAKSGSALSAALKQHFQKVFDYRDGKSIRPGQPWLDEIFDQLSASAIGISLLSKDYIKSGNCMHEARDMVAKLDNRNMKLVPVLLPGKEIDIPSWLTSIQYAPWKPNQSAEELVQTIIDLTRD